MAQLAQAYIHLKPYAASHRKLRDLGKAAERIGLRAAGEIFGPGVAVEVELEEGSLRTRVTVIGTIGILALGTYEFIANYKDFKEGVVEMCDDAREFAVDVCKPFVKKAGVEEEEIYRFERRTKTPGKLYRLAKRLERLHNGVSELSPKDMQRELRRARRDLAAVRAELSEDEGKKLQQALVSDKLPPVSEWPEDLPEPARVAKEEVPAELTLFDLAPSQDVEPDGQGRRVYHSITVVPANKRNRIRHVAPSLLPVARQTKQTPPPEPQAPTKP